MLKTDFILLSIILLALNSLVYAYFLRKNGQLYLQETLSYRDMFNTALVGLTPGYVINIAIQMTPVADNIYQTNTIAAYVSISLGYLVTASVISILTTHWYIQRFTSYLLAIEQKKYWMLLLLSYIKSTLVLILLIVIFVILQVLMSETNIN